MEPFRQMGAQIERAFRAADYDERAFPAIAAEALAARALHRELGWADVLRWTLTADELPQQNDLKARFGDVPVTVYHGRRFFIQVLCWTEGTTAIHRHGFSGAFQVLEGTSLHTRYAFRASRRVSSRLLLGELARLDAGLLRRGAVEPITNDLAHALFHLESHAATIVVRTYREDDAHPQYSYRPPGLAIDPFYDDPVATRQLQALRFLRSADAAQHLDAAVDLAARADLHTGYLVLSEVARGAGDAERIERVTAALRARHGAEVAERLRAVVLEEMRDRLLVGLRGRTDDADARFLLVLLASLRDRAPIVELVRARAGAGVDPYAWILERLRAVSGTDRIGLDLADDFTASCVAALLGADSDAQALARLAEVYGADELAAQREQAMRHLARIRRSALAPLFRVAP